MWKFVEKKLEKKKKKRKKKEKRREDQTEERSIPFFFLFLLSLIHCLVKKYAKKQEIRESFVITSVHVSSMSISKCS